MAKARAEGEADATGGETLDIIESARRYAIEQFRSLEQARKSNDVSRWIGPAGREVLRRHYETSEFGVKPRCDWSPGINWLDPRACRLAWEEIARLATLLGFTQERLDTSTARDIEREAESWLLSEDHKHAKRPGRRAPRRPTRKGAEDLSDRTFLEAKALQYWLTAEKPTWSGLRAALGDRRTVRHLQRLLQKTRKQAEKEWALRKRALQGKGKQLLSERADGNRRAGRESNGDR